MFLLLVLVLSTPFYLLNLFNIPTPLALPPSFLMILVPFVVALWMTRLGSKKYPVKNLFQPFVSLENKSHLLWLVLSILIMPLLALGMYSVSTFLAEDSLKLPSIALSALTVTAFLYFIGAIFEEVGWSMYATKRFLQKHSVLVTGLAIGLVWELWHVIPFISQGRSITWIIGQCLFGIAVRIIMVLIFSKTRYSLLPMLIIHASLNLWPDFLPGGLSSYNPMIMAILTWTAVVILLVINRDTSLSSDPTDDKIVS